MQLRYSDLSIMNLVKKIQYLLVYCQKQKLGDLYRVLRLLTLSLQTTLIQVAILGDLV